MTPSSFSTHDVLNQSPPFWDVDLFAADLPLVEAVVANGGAAALAELSEFGKHWGSAAMAERGRLANENTPKLRTFDARGVRRDEVEFHPAYQFDMERRGQAGRRGCRSGPRREILYGGWGRDRPLMPGHHDSRRGGGSGSTAGSPG
jgi:hypothetical protein